MYSSGDNLKEEYLRETLVIERSSVFFSENNDGSLSRLVWLKVMKMGVLDNFAFASSNS